MKSKDLISSLKLNGVTRFFGVPDTFLYPITSQLANDELIIVPNEGNAVSMAFGYSITTSRMPVIFYKIQD